MDQELIAYLDKRFGENAEQIQNLREEFGGLRDEVGGVRGEVGGLRDEVRDLRGEFEAFRETTTRNFERMGEEIRHNGVSVEGARDDIRGIAEGLMCMDEKLGFFRKEVEQEFEDIRKLIRPVYSTYDQRLQTLEMRKDFQRRDPVEMVRERFGLKPPDKPSE